MWPSIMSAWPAHCDRFEGRLGFMYLDSLGLVTTGRGNLIDPVGAALPLPWLRKASSTMANQEEIVSEWNHVKGHQEMKLEGGWAFEAITRLFLSWPSVDALTFRRLEANEAILTTGPLAPVWTGLCADAQLVCHSMSWAMGAHFTHGYPRFTTAMVARDFPSAADECAITHPVNESILARNALNVRGLVNAATVAAAGLDPAICWSLRE